MAAFDEALIKIGDKEVVLICIGSAYLLYHKGVWGRAGLTIELKNAAKKKCYSLGSVSGSSAMRIMQPPVWPPVNRLRNAVGASSSPS